MYSFKLLFVLALLVQLVVVEATIDNEWNDVSKEISSLSGSDMLRLIRLLFDVNAIYIRHIEMVGESEETKNSMFELYKHLAKRGVPVLNPGSIYWEIAVEFAIDMDIDPLWEWLTDAAHKTTAEDVK